MSPLLDGPGRRELRVIVLEAFDRSKFERALAEASPAREFSHMVAQGPFEDQVAELIDYAEREGWLEQFERLLIDELPQREDLHARVKAVLRTAAQNARDIDAGDTPAVAIRGRLVRSASIGFALGIAGGLLGVVAFTGNALAGPWPLVLGLVSLLLGMMWAALLVNALLKDRMGDRAVAFMRSKLPVAGLAGLGALALANGFLLWEANQDKRPNFILQVISEIEGNRGVVANQPVHLYELVSPGEHDHLVKKVTDLNGQAFFHLRLGTGILYSGGIFSTEGDSWRNCTFPAFPALAERSVVQNVAALNCLEGRGTQRAVPNAETALRVSHDFVSPAPLPAGVRSRLPTDSAARTKRAPLGLPDAPVIMDRIYYSLGYDPARRVPLWAAFAVDGRRDIPRRNRSVRFEPDPDLPPEFQSSTTDYRNNPYDRGHLVASADARIFGAQADREAFYYTATVPQAKETNRGIWARLEKFTRELAGRAGPIYVVSGPIYNQTLVMGPDQTLVPFALYRVLLRRISDGNWRTLAFVVNNDGSIDEFDPGLLVITVNEVEHFTGFEFFPNLPEDEAARLKSNIKIDSFSGND